MKLKEFGPPGACVPHAPLDPPLVQLQYDVTEVTDPLATGSVTSLVGVKVDVVTLVIRFIRLLENCWYFEKIEVTNQFGGS